MCKLFIFWLLVFNCLISTNYNFYGSVNGKVISKEEKDGFGGGDIDEQLKILNKPAIKSFKTRGVNIDCIDINKQPALDHPLLKDHIVQRRPSSTPKDSRFPSSVLASKLQQPWRDAYLRTYKCPEGTVPIRKTSKQDLIRAKSFSESFRSIGRTFHPNAPSAQPYVEYVAWRHSYNKTDVSTPPIMHGLQAEIRVDNPAAQNDQISASVLLAEGGPENVFSSIMAGWMVAPTLYGDNHTHIFTFWRDGPTNGCFDIQCPGFVQVDSSVRVGEVLEPISEYGGQGYSFTGKIYQDVKSLNWWLVITVHNTPYNIGYWPREIIPYLTNTANYIAWGGLVRTPPNTPGPPMGNGHFPEGDFTKVSAMLNLLYVDDTYTLASPGDDRFWNRIDNDDCYDLKYYPDYKVGKVIHFGGPGGNC